MLRNLTVIVLIFAFTAQTFNLAVIQLDYVLNTASFEKNCENKAKPAMKCHGKCQMMKQIKNEEKKDQQNPERKLENKNELALSSKSFYPFINPGIKSFSQKHIIPSLGKEKKMPRSILRPPIC